MIFDAGVLIGAQRDDRRFITLAKALLQERVVPIVPAPVVAEVWRDGAKQARLARALGRNIQVVPCDDTMARIAGRLLGMTGGTNVVDAIVVAAALHYRRDILTGDVADLEAIAARSSVRVIAF